MKTFRVIVLGFLLLAFGIPVAHAARPKPAKVTKKEQKNAAMIIARYDKNKNGYIDADEVDAIKNAFNRDPALKQFDKNGDGKLDDIEISAMNPTEKKKKK